MDAATQGAKRRRPLVDYADDDEDQLEVDQPSSPSPPPQPHPPLKRRRIVDQAAPHRIASSAHTSPPAAGSPPLRATATDRLSRLSDELLVRILSFLTLPHLLLAVAPVSHRFHRLAADSQLWKALYYGRFVLPRAMRIPGFREGGGGGGARHRGDHKLHYSGRRKLWADGRQGGIVRDTVRRKAARDGSHGPQPAGRHGGDSAEMVDWKRQYRLRHNWSRGKCAVEELKIGLDGDTEEQEDTGGRRMLVKVIEGVAITADAKAGLRVWDLKTRDLLTQVDMGNDDGTTPTCMAVDDQNFSCKTLDVAIGFVDGSFGVWRLDTAQYSVVQRYWHQKSSNGELVGMAYSHPYLLTATESVLISLYTFNGPSKSAKEDANTVSTAPAKEAISQNDSHQRVAESVKATQTNPKTAEMGHRLRPAYLLTSLRSHTSRPPLALSIRRTASTTIASIAYTFSTRQGWSIGIQDLHIKPPTGTNLGTTPEVTTTRLAYTPPIISGRSSGPSSSPPSTPPRHNNPSNNIRPFDSSPAASPAPRWSSHDDAGPTSLCYTHPYLLATLPDNTLILHLCTSNASTLSVSAGIRLWGHTSGISDAEITARGKAVSVSSRGDEMRVWELEGRPSAAFSGRSVAIRPNSGVGVGDAGEDGDGMLPPLVKYDDDGGGGSRDDWDERRNWVGFDDEMVIVLKESREGKESLMVYDFT